MAKLQRILFALTIYSLVAFNGIDAFNMVKNVQQFISSEKIEAEDYSTILGDFTLYNDCSDPNVFYLGSLAQDTVIGYQQVNFLDGMNIVILHIDNWGSSTADVSLHLGNYTNPPFITIPVDSIVTDACDFGTLNVNLGETLTGVQDLYFTFPSAQEGVLHIDWFVFNQTTDTFIATQKIEAEDFSYAYYYATYDDCSDTSISYVGQLTQASTLAYERVDFGSGVQMVTLQVSSGFVGDPLDISLHLGSSTNAPIATIPVGQTGDGRCDFFTLNAFLDTKPSGVQDLFFTFPSTQGDYLHLNWFIFNQTLTHQ